MNVEGFTHRMVQRAIGGRGGIRTGFVSKGYAASLIGFGLTGHINSRLRSCRS
jgi:hypothetical protein